MNGIVMRPYTVPAVTARKFRRDRTERGATVIELQGLAYALILSTLEKARCPLQLASLALEMIAEDIEAERLEDSLTWAPNLTALREPYREDFRENEEEDDAE